MLIQNPAEAGLRIFPVLAGRKNQMSSKLAFPQFALLEQNLQIFVYAIGIRANPKRNTKCQPIQLSKIAVPGSSEPFRAWRNVRPPHFQSVGTIKNPASSAGPSRPNIPGRVRAMLDYLLP